MKITKVLIVLNILFWSIAIYESAHAEAVVKKVCHTVNGKEVCKNIKTHQKVEGTPVPEKAPAPAKKAKKK
jgi:hypothetical protein